MLSRRALLLSLPPVLVGACSRQEAAPQKASLESPRRATYEGVGVIELFTRGADESAPVLVAVHGRGDAPENWIPLWSDFPGRARIVLPRAFHSFGTGWSWFDLHDGMSDAELGAAVGEAEARLWKGIAAIATGKKLIVTGFSQGGILSFAMAARHPDAIAKAFPVSGSCPGPLLPKDRARAAPLVAFHGTEDRVLDVKWGRGAVNAFKEQGDDATLREYPGIGHAISPAMRQDLRDEILKVL